MTMNKELHPTSDVALSFVSGKNGGRTLIGCENRVKSEENGLGWCVENNIEPLLAAVRTSRTITHEETVDLKEFKSSLLCRTCGTRNETISHIVSECDKPAHK